MPWTEQQTRYLLSSGSPLSGAQKDKMKSELHGNPAMAHARPGPDANPTSKARYNSYLRKEKG